MKNVVQPLKKFKKDKALALRKEGHSYSEIQKKLSVSKSTLSLWLRGVVLNESQLKKLDARRRDTAKENSRKRILQTSRLIDEIKNTSSKDIGKISKKEFWLMGVMLYWRERAASGNETDVRNGVRFTSSNPELIKLFLDWLQEIGGIEDREIKLDIFINESRKDSIKEIITHWSKVSGFSENYFTRIYFQKNNAKKNKQVKINKNKQDYDGNDDEKNEDSADVALNTKKNNFGLLRVRVKASSMLARQIAGWIKGIIEHYRY